MQEEWFIWVIKQNRFEQVEAFLKTLPEIEDVLYPTASKEYKMKRGSIRKKRVPLYSGYLFLKYKDDPQLFSKLNSNPFMTTYVGRCTGKDLEKVREVKQVEEWNVVNKRFEVDDIVKINCGPFKGFDGIVVEMNSNKVSVTVPVFGRDVKVSINKEDADIVKRGKP